MADADTAITVTALSSSATRSAAQTSVVRSAETFNVQAFGLLPILSAAENVGVPPRIAGMPRHEREQRVQLMLDITGLGGHAAQRPGELSAASTSGWPSRVLSPARRRC